MTTKTTPRISINKLGEYIEANSTRRKQIVKDSKYPSSFKTTRYSDAREAVKNYIIKNQDESIITDAIELLESKTGDSSFQEQDNKLSIEVLEMVLDNDISVLDGYEFASFTENNKLVTISGVNISVYPDLIIKKEISGKTNVGIIKFHISKNGELKEESLKVIAAMLYKYTQDYIVTGKEVSNIKMCLSFDLFNGSFESSPKSYALRMKRIEAACEEIALWWDKL